MFRDTLPRCVLALALDKGNSQHGQHIQEFCSDINPQQTLGKVHNQHQPLVQRLRTRSLRGISRNNQVTLHVILLGVKGKIYK